MRLFAALDLTDEARASIAAQQERIIARLGEASRSLRLVRPEHMHLTLVFVGEVPPSTSALIVETMGARLDQRHLHRSHSPSARRRPF